MRINNKGKVRYRAVVYRILCKVIYVGQGQVVTVVT